MTRLSWNFLSYTIYFYHLLFRMKYNIFTGLNTKCGMNEM